MLGIRLEKFLEAQAARMVVMDVADGIERKKNWMPYIDERTGMERPATELLYRNSIKWLRSNEARQLLGLEHTILESHINEATLQTDIGTFTTQYLPLVRRIYHNLIATDLVSVQPMRGPSGYIFYANRKFGDDYLAESISDGDRVDEKFPVGYASSSEGGTIRELDFEIKKKLIEAINYKLQANFSLEAGQDLESQNALNMESEIASALSEEIAIEIDRYIVNALLAGSAYNVDWNKNGSLGAGSDLTSDSLAYRRTLLTDGIVAANAYIRAKKFQNAGFLVMDSDTLTFLERLEEYKLAGPIENLTGQVGMNLMGVLKGQYKVYCAPYFQANTILVGTLPQDWKRAAGVFCPYIPIFLSETFIKSNDFSNKLKGGISRLFAGIIPETETGLGSDFSNSLATVTITSS